MYWIWANEPSDEDEAMLYGVPDAVKQLDLNFDKGALVTVKVPLIEFIRDEDSQGVLTDNLIAPGSRGLLFSTRLRELLAGQGVNNIQYFPVRVTNPKNSTTTDDYQLSNLIGSIACIDQMASNLEMHPHILNTIEFINALILDETKIKDNLMFRAAEFTQVIVVHERIKNACEDAGITGVVFYSPAGFTL